MTKKIRPLRAALEGKEFDEEYYFAYSASLRIFGRILDFDTITNRLGLSPTTIYRKGDRRTSRSTPYEHDMWLYKVSLPETDPLEKHIEFLWSQLKHHKEYLLSLKRDLTVDVFLGYRSNCDHAGIDLPSSALEIFTELKTPFSLSIIIT